MHFLRTARQPGFVRASITSSPSSRAVAARRFASGDYGSGATNSDTPNNAVEHEHPGPGKPEAAKQGGGSASGQQQQQGQGSKSNSEAQPKILSESPPAEHEQSDEVKQHNKEMSNRADKATENVSNEDAKSDKVHKGYWKGSGGVDNKS